MLLLNDTDRLMYETKTNETKTKMFMDILVRMKKFLV